MRTRNFIPSAFCFLALLYGPGLVPAVAQDPTEDPAVQALFAKLDELEGWQRELLRIDDLATLVEETGGDPEKLCSWVRQNIAHEGYEGFMKGGVGTLASRRANAADRAWLLAELLEAAGIESKLVHASIPSARLPAEALPPELAPRTESAVTLEDIAARSGIPLAAMKAAHEKALRDSAAFSRELQVRAKADLQALARELDAARVERPSSPAGSMTDHWWVRAGGRDLDPTLESAPQEPSAELAREEIPPDRFHRLQIGMVLTDSTTSTRVMEVTFRTARLHGEVVSIGNLPRDCSSQLRSLLTSPEAALDVLAATPSLIPVVAVGEEMIAGRSFDLHGRLLDGVAEESGAADAGSAVTGLFGAVAGDTNPPPASPSAPDTKQIAGFRLEFTLHGPGVTEITHRRELLTPGSDARQKTLDLLGVRELIVLPEDLTPDRVERRRIDHSASLRPLLGEHGRSLRERAGLPPGPPAPREESPLLDFGLARSAALRELAASRGGVWSRRRPTVVTYVRRLVDGAPARLIQGFDILENATIQPGPGATRWADSLALAAGVLDTVLESMILDRSAPDLNTSDLWQKSRAAGTSTTLLRERIPAGIELSPAARASLERDLEGAICLMIPGSPVSWYRIRLADGATLGIVGGGGGQALMEDLLTGASAINDLNSALDFYAKMFRCIGLGVTAPLAGAGGKDELLECLHEIGCGKVRDVVKKGVNVKPSAVSFCLDLAIKQVWKELCQSLWSRTH